MKSSDRIDKPGFRRTESDEAPAPKVKVQPETRPHAASFDEYGSLGSLSSLLGEDKIGKSGAAQTIRKVLSPVLPQTWAAPSNDTGLHIAFGSRTRRGLHHANEDRHAITIWNDWVNPPAHGDETKALKEYPDAAPRPPQGQVFAPTCIGSARKDTSVTGSGNSDSQAIQKADENSPLQKRKAFMWLVCDGHDGPQAADFVCSELGATFSRLWYTQPLPIPSSRRDSKDFTKSGQNAASLGESLVSPRAKTSERDLSVAYSTVLARAFETVDAQFKNAVTSGGALKSCTAGSCVTALFLVGDTLCCAGIGDCKAAVLTLEEGPMSVSKSPQRQSIDSSAPPPAQVQQFQVTWFSKDHRSSSPKERARIKANGGWFIRGRVGGVLEPTRTIGDFDVKESQPPGVVISTPEVRTYNVQRPALVVIATDGVWDVMDAAQLLKTLKQRKRLWRSVLTWLGAPQVERRSIRNFGFRRRAKSKEGWDSLVPMPSGGDLSAVGDTIIARAQDLGSDDDCTCMVVFVRPPVLRRPEEGRKYTDSGMPTVDENVEEEEMTIKPIPEEIEDDEDDDYDELDEDVPVPEPALPPPEQQENLKRVESQYEKWHMSEAERESASVDQEDDLDKIIDSKAEDHDFSTASFPLSFFPHLSELETQFPPTLNPPQMSKQQQLRGSAGEKAVEKKT